MRPARLLLAAAIVAGLVLAFGRGILPRRNALSEPPAGPVVQRLPANGDEEYDGGREPHTLPSDWFFAQRAFPTGEIPQEKFLAAVERARFSRSSPLRSKEERSLATSALAWTQAGPYNIGGRVTCIAAAPGGVTAYLGSANGGVFKSVNSGTNWAPIFDLGFSIFSIGAIAMAPSDSNIVLVGTGEANASVDSYDGAGLFRTRDGGGHWQSLGLSATGRIARIAIDPADTGRIFVAAMGPQFSTGPDRGLYRSEDGGASFSKVLFVNDSTGACDVAINPAHPETVFCATWERVRHPTYRRAYGPGCGIWRSVNHGTTWTRLSTGLPIPSDNVGRIGLALAPSQPSTIYAQIITGASLGYVGLGIYRSIDGGSTWARRDPAGGAFVNNFRGFGWYFGEVKVDPANPNLLYELGVGLLRSTDGGATNLSILGSAHVDGHAMWIDPTNSSRIYLGNDGGFYRSTTGGGTWIKSLDLPISQFYAGAVDPQNASKILGGTQDNGTLATTGSPTAWTALGIGGDGFQCLVDPTNSSIVFAEWQFCCDNTGLRRSINGGSSFSAPSGFFSADRYNWSTPIAMNPLNHNLLLVGSQRVYRSTNNGVNYSVISGDLTTNPVTQLVYGTLTTLDISPADTNRYYAGSDDGKVWRTANRGGVWTDISAGLPVRWVTRVTADPVDPLTVYVTLSGFGSDEHLPHVFRSTDAGDSWTSIAGDLPDAPANDLLVDPAEPSTLFLGTDVGVYVTRNLGASWFPLGMGMPAQTIFDLTLHDASRTLVAATHGRSQWRLDLNAMPVAVGPPAPAARFTLGAPAPNPSRGEIRLTLDLPGAAEVDAAVYDVQGRRVRTIAAGPRETGTHVLRWDGLDEGGRPADPGAYFVRATSRGEIATRRLALLR
jgi:photosystem II stability/assembly factor-like uncharacterized protein